MQLKRQKAQGGQQGAAESAEKVSGTDAGGAEKNGSTTVAEPPAKKAADELAPYGLSVDDFADYCKHHTSRGWDGSQVAGIVDQIRIAHVVAKIPDDLRKRVRHAILSGGDTTLGMDEIGGTAVIGTRQVNADRRADAAATMERETLSNMAGGIAGAVAGGVVQELHPEDRARVHAASGMGALVDNVAGAHALSHGNEPKLEPPVEHTATQHGSPTQAAGEQLPHEPAAPAPDFRPRAPAPLTEATKPQRLPTGYGLSVDPATGALSILLDEQARSSGKKYPELSWDHAVSQFLDPKTGHRFDTVEDVERHVEVRNTPKGSRPDPASYLSPTYLARHLEQFKVGASYLVPKDALDRYGRAKLGWPDNTQFVMSKTEMDALLSRAHGSIEALEREIGIPPGAWQGRAIVRIDILDPTKLKARMPSGNEMGANDLWMPGGKLPTGAHEAVLDSIPEGLYKETVVAGESK
jgi:hypothetical protein